MYRPYKHKSIQWLSHNIDQMLPELDRMRIGGTVEDNIRAAFWDELGLLMNEYRRQTGKVYADISDKGM